MNKHSRAKRTLQEIRMAETKKDALVVFNAFDEIASPISVTGVDPGVAVPNDARIRVIG